MYMTPGHHNNSNTGERRGSREITVLVEGGQAGKRSLEKEGETIFWASISGKHAFRDTMASHIEKEPGFCFPSLVGTDQTETSLVFQTYHSTHVPGSVHNLCLSKHLWPAWRMDTMACHRADKEPESPPQ